MRFVVENGKLTGANLRTGNSQEVAGKRGVGAFGEIFGITKVTNKDVVAGNSSEIFDIPVKGVNRIDIIEKDSCVLIRVEIKEVQEN